jgi:hypothetical protein
MICGCDVRLDADHDARLTKHGVNVYSQRSASRPFLKMYRGNKGTRMPEASLEGNKWKIGAGGKKKRGKGYNEQIATNKWRDN